LGFQGQLHVVSRQFVELGWSEVRTGGDLDNGEVGLSGDEALRGQSADTSDIGAERGDLGAAAGEGFGIGLRPDFVEGSEITLEKVELAEEGDGRLRVRRTGIKEVGAELKHGVAFRAERVAQRAEIDELEDIAGDRAARGIARIAAGCDEAQLAIADCRFIAAPKACLVGKAALQTVLIE
jgi:hypothetical protein